MTVSDRAEGTPETGRRTRGDEFPEPVEQRLNRFHSRKLQCCQPRSESVKPCVARVIASLFSLRALYSVPCRPCGGSGEAIGFVHFKRPKTIMRGPPLIRIRRAHSVDQVVDIRQAGIHKHEKLPDRRPRFHQLRRNVLIDEAVPDVTQDRERDDVMP